METSLRLRTLLECFLAVPIWVRQQAWSRFFTSLAANPEPHFIASTRAELLHSYIDTQLRLGLEPEHKDVLQRYRLEIAGYHQRFLEVAAEEQFERLEGVFEWIRLNLGPWPV
jgi:hypothetical protein